MLIVFIFLCLSYWVFYILLRRKMRINNSNYEIRMAILTIYGAALVLYLPVTLFNKNNIFSLLFTFSSILSVLNLILHNISVISKRPKLLLVSTERIHWEISHTLWFTGFALYAICSWVILYPLTQNITDVLLLFVFVALTVTFSTIGLLTGFKLIKLTY